MTATQPLTCKRCGHVLPDDAPHGICPHCLVAMNFASQTGLSGESGAAPAPPPSPEDLAPLFPQLEILEFLGRGGMGIVYKARQKALGRVVALKLLAPEREHNEKFAERFAREAQALAALDHPNIVTIHDFGQASGFFYLLMEYVDGLNLRHVLQARKLSPSEALGIVPKLCEALQFAHDRGIVHRDIKPENLLLARDGRIKVADFGIAKILGSDGPQDEIAGTPAYMAPEQKLKSDNTDSRVDIYSLGVVLYEMLTGELPRESIVPPSRRVAVDVRVDEVVLRALEASPELRWQTANSFRTGVETCANIDAVSSAHSTTDTPRKSARPWMSLRRFAINAAMYIVAVIVAVGVLLAGLTWLYGNRQAPPTEAAALISSSANLVETAANLPSAADPTPVGGQPALTPERPALPKAAGPEAVQPQESRKQKTQAGEWPKTRIDPAEITAARAKLARAVEEFRATAAAYENKMVSSARYDKARFPVDYALAVLRGDLEKARSVREAYRNTYTSRQNAALREHYISPNQKLEALRDLDEQCARTESAYAILAGQILPADEIVAKVEFPDIAPTLLTTENPAGAPPAAFAFSSDAPAGVGIVLNRPHEIFYVGDVLPGSPAAASNRIHQGDRILAVGEGEAASQPVAGKSVEDVVAMIRGAKGTRVRLTVASPDQSDSASHEITLVRDELKAASGVQ